MNKHSHLRSRSPRSPRSPRSRQYGRILAILAGALGLSSLLALSLFPPTTGAIEPAASSTEAMDSSGDLRPVAAFEAIVDKAERSAALFNEAGKVLTHPRCVNCHPAGDRPLQRDGEPHEPPVLRGPTGNGVVGMRCETCHLEENFDPGTVPGAPQWHLAPRPMAWEGLSVAEICAQIKDPQRNGGRDLKAIVHHMKEDALVGWGWNPGADREPAPGDQETFGALIAAWVKTGAVCP